MTRCFASVLIILTIGAAMAACSQGKTITVFAAASLENALDDVDAAFTKQTGVKVVASYDASSALMKQIESGAPADAFLSANLQWMDYGVEKKVINESTRCPRLRSYLRKMWRPQMRSPRGTTLKAYRSTNASEIWCRMRARVICKPSPR